MEWVCECGRWFELSYFKRKQILKGIEVFCSTRCLASYLTVLELSDNNNPIHDSRVGKSTISEPLVYWDKFTHRFYRSKSEAIAANFFNMNRVEWEYERYVICIDGCTKTYTPDFYLPKSKAFVEVKGLWKGSSKKKVVSTISMGFRLVVIPHYLVQLMERGLREVNLF